VYSSYSSQESRLSENIYFFGLGMSFELSFDVSFLCDHASSSSRTPASPAITSYESPGGQVVPSIHRRALELRSSVPSRIVNAEQQPSFMTGNPPLDSAGHPNALLRGQR